MLSAWTAFAAVPTPKSWFGHEIGADKTVLDWEMVVTYFQTLAQSIQDHLRRRMPEWRRTHAGVENLAVAVMGCVVNGPGESKQANIGISLPGTGERPVAPVYEDGAKTVTLKGERIAEEFQQLVEQYVERSYPRRARP